VRRIKTKQREDKKELRADTVSTLQSTPNYEHQKQLYDSK
jgi:hypothetical protein